MLHGQLSLGLSATVVKTWSLGRYTSRAAWYHLAPSIDRMQTYILLQGALDAIGACCDGVVDNFGVCNGYDASGIFQVALAEGSSITVLAAALGLTSSKLISATE